MTAITYLVLGAFAAVGWLMVCVWIVSLVYTDESETDGEFLLGFALYTVTGLFGIAFFSKGVNWHTLGIVLGTLAFGVGLLGAACVIGLFREWWPDKTDREWAKLSLEEKWARYAQLADSQDTT